MSISAAIHWIQYNGDIFTFKPAVTKKRSSPKHTKHTSSLTVSHIAEILVPFDWSKAIKLHYKSSWGIWLRLLSINKRHSNSSLPYDKVANLNLLAFYPSEAPLCVTSLISPEWNLSGLFSRVICFPVGTTFLGLIVSESISVKGLRWHSNFFVIKNKRPVKVNIRWIVVNAYYFNVIVIVQ